MRWQNTERQYGWVSVALHWLGALSIIAMLVIGLRADFAGDAGDRATRSEWMGLHLSLGVTVWLILLARVVFHFVQRQPDPPPQAPALSFVAAATHNLLLLAIVLLIVSGPLAVFSGGRDIDVWGLFSLATPFAERNEFVHDLAEKLHAAGRYMLYVLLPLHILGALKHLIVDRDGVFKRIFVPRQ